MSTFVIDEAKLEAMTDRMVSEYLAAEYSAGVEYSPEEAKLEREATRRVILMAWDLGTGQGLDVRPEDREKIIKNWVMRLAKQ